VRRQHAGLARGEPSVTPGPDAGLRGILRQWLPAVHWQTIEVGLVGRGVPDANGCVLIQDPKRGPVGVEFWVECKRVDGWAVNLEPEQVAWLLRRTRAGGRTFVACRKFRDAPTARLQTCDELWLFAGRHARELKDAGMRHPAIQPLVQTNGGPSRWDWGRVLEALVG
jgi:hypothetical protein